MKTKWKKLPSKVTPQIRSYEEALKRGNESRHVIALDDKWGIKKAGASRISKGFKTKDAAVDYAKKVAKKNKVNLFIHDKEGRIQTSKSY